MMGGFGDELEVFRREGMVMDIEPVHGQEYCIYTSQINKEQHGPHHFLYSSSLSSRETWPCTLLR